ncbi:sulfate adenylyltransferase [Carboxydochorda subterranea]|uniref:Sulfate adenylyltransferase n=1 Tax=Carboxydichorda subterranea TaxID=3109565 RepID=A0ABZ1BY64_9FIRM|nr:sulfate adenylyltransferase [Limnochorda sp. L945t]WRP17023.1 sulfate adenylyltransferase [Limnochorda sp. L945t]
MSDHSGPGCRDAGPIAPYGGRLVNARVRGRRAAELRTRSFDAVWRLSEEQASDLLLVADGAYSPLEGFMDRQAYEQVVCRMTLPGGLPWTIPIVLRIDGTLAARLRPGDALALVEGDSPEGAAAGPARQPGVLAGGLTVTDVWKVDLREEARRVYGTEDPSHPGVARLFRAPEWCAGGPVEVLEWWRPRGLPASLTMRPARTRQLFLAAGWRSVAAFQTRNPAHRAHEHLQKCALEQVDGLLIHPLVGPTRDADLPSGVRMRAYEILLWHYYPPERTVLSAFPAPMRYAGPREAVFHAIVRRNYGCTHFVVGRDHAGADGFYGPYEAQAFFDRFDPGVLGIVPLKFGGAFFCRACGGMASERTCPHGHAGRVVLSGTELRRRLRAGEPVPAEFARPQVTAFLQRALAGR